MPKIKLVLQVLQLFHQFPGFKCLGLLCSLTNLFGAVVLKAWSLEIEFKFQDNSEKQHASLPAIMFSKFYHRRRMRLEMWHEGTISPLRVGIASFSFLGCPPCRGLHMLT